MMIMTETLTFMCWSAVWWDCPKIGQHIIRCTCRYPFHSDAYGNNGSSNAGRVSASKASDSKCQAAGKSVRLPASWITDDHHGFLVRQVRVSRALQKYVPVTLHAYLLYLSHYPTLARHHREQRMYDTMRRHFFWSHMANDVHRTEEDWSSCAQNVSQVKHIRKLPLFPAVGPVEFVAIDVLGPLLETLLGNTRGY